MLDLIIFIAGMVLITVLVYAVITLALRNKMLKKDVAQGLIDQFALMQKLEEALKNTDEKKIEETEGFLKFVSESRDWAFQYIERVQVAIKKFQDVFHPFAVQYYENKRTRIPKEEFPALVEAYKKLVEELPDEGKK